MHKYNSRIVVTIVRMTPAMAKGMDVLIPATLIGSFTTALYIVSVLVLLA